MIKWGKKMELVVINIIGKPMAILHSDGLLLFESIKKAGNSPINLSFKGIEHCTTAFLNASIGNYIIYSKDPALTFTNTNPIIDKRIQIVLDNAGNNRAQLTNQH